MLSASTAVMGVQTPPLL